MVWEAFVSVGFPWLELMLDLGNQLSIFVGPPPCPQDGPGVLERTVHYAVSVARSVAWGQPCPG